MPHAHVHCARPKAHWSERMLQATSEQQVQQLKALLDSGPHGHLGRDTHAVSAGTWRKYDTQEAHTAKPIKDTLCQNGNEHARTHGKVACLQDADNGARLG